jgi:hypothetical protein
MATWKKYYIGDRGPFYYDADLAVEDPDGDFSGENYHGVLTDGDQKASKFVKTGTGTDPDELTSHSDVDTKINGLSLSSTTETKTVVTDVDFVNETITTEDITYVTDVSLVGQP